MLFRTFICFIIVQVSPITMRKLSIDASSVKSVAIERQSWLLVTFATFFGRPPPPSSALSSSLNLWHPSGDDTTVFKRRRRNKSSLRLKKLIVDLDIYVSNCSNNARQKDSAHNRNICGFSRDERIIYLTLKTSTNQSWGTCCIFFGSRVSSPKEATK